MYSFIILVFFLTFIYIILLDHYIKIYSKNSNSTYKYIFRVSSIFFLALLLLSYMLSNFEINPVYTNILIINTLLVQGVITMAFKLQISKLFSY